MRCSAYQANEILCPLPPPCKPSKDVVASIFQGEESVLDPIMQVHVQGLISGFGRHACLIHPGKAIEIPEQVVDIGKIAPRTVHTDDEIALELMQGLHVFPENIRIELAHVRILEQPCFDGQHVREAVFHVLSPGLNLLGQKSEVNREGVKARDMA